MTKDRTFIVELVVENLYRLTAAHVKLDPKGGLVVVSGKNKQGKTSLLRAVAGVLGGANHVAEDPIHTASDTGTGRVAIRLDNGFHIERQCTPSNPKGKLVVTGPDGTRGSQSTLNDWLGPLAFDPMAFYGLSVARQTEILLGLGKDPKLPAKLDKLNAERKQLYDDRIPSNRRLQRAQRHTPPEGERPEPVDVSAEVRQLKGLQEQKEVRDDVVLRGAQHRTTAAQQKDWRAAKIQTIERLEADLQEAIGKRDALQVAMEDSEAEAERLDGVAAGMLDPTEEIAAVQARLSLADTLQEALEPWHEHDRAQVERQEAEAEAEVLTAQIQKVDKKKANLLKNAGIEIPGLSFDANGAALLNNQPLELASHREQAIMAAQVGTMADTGLSAILIDEANSLDDDGMREMAELAEEKDCQIFVVRIEPTTAGELIVVDDGVAKNIARPSLPVASGQAVLERHRVRPVGAR